MRKPVRTGIVILLMISLCACGKTAAVTEDMIIESDSQASVITESLESWCAYSENYLKDLRDTYELEKLTEKCQSDYERARAVTRWVSGLWQHDGENEPEQNDPMYILDQVINHGQRYRCVEYGIVICACLNALGMESRKLSLKTKDAETRPYGAGHVGCEVYLEDVDKWVFIDGQWGAIPVLDKTPLNAYEFGVALREKDEQLRINWVNNVYQSTDDNYFEWIGPYLYYLDSAFKTADGEFIHVMYVPEDGTCITVFQKKYDINVDYYLKDADLFYYRKSVK